MIDYIFELDDCVSLGFPVNYCRFLPRLSFLLKPFLNADTRTTAVAILSNKLFIQ